MDFSKKTIAGVSHIFLHPSALPENSVTTSVDFTNEDSKDIVFPGGFRFTSDYHVYVTLYLAESESPVTWNVVPRGSDPTPPAAKALDGFRLVLSAPSTCRALVWAWAVQ